MNRRLLLLFNCLFFIFACDRKSNSSSSKVDDVLSAYRNLRQLIEVIEKSDAPIILDSFFCKQYFCPVIEKLDFHHCSNAIFYSGQLEYQQDSFFVISLFYKNHSGKDQLNSKLLIALNLNRNILLDALVFHSKGFKGNKNIKIESEFKHEGGPGFFIFQKLYDSKHLNQYLMKKYLFDTQGYFSKVKL